MTVNLHTLALQILAASKQKKRLAAQRKPDLVRQQAVERQEPVVPQRPAVMQPPSVGLHALALRIMAASAQKKKLLAAQTRPSRQQEAQREPVPPSSRQPVPQPSRQAGRPQRSLQVAEAFTGGGLFTLAFAIEGIDVQQVCEINKHAVASLRQNLHADARICDAFQWEPEVPEGGLDILAGGPPCQPWSKAGQKLGQKDPRNMYPRILEWIRSSRPRIVCLENSDEIVKDEAFIKYFREDWWRPLAEMGYEGTIWALDAADYGTPQHRLRAFVVAWPIGSSWGRSLREAPPPTHGRPGTPQVKAGRRLPWTRAFDRLASGCCGGYALFDCRNLGNLDRACETCAMGGDLPSNYEPLPDAARTRLTDQNRALLAAEKHGRPRVLSFPPTDIGGAEAWTELGLEDRQITRYLAPVVVANLRRGMPLGVITTEESPSRDALDKNDPASVKRYVASLARIAVRDAAKLQDVPQWYTFSGSHRDAFEQIGNGIPVNLGRAVARHLLMALGRETPLPGSLAASRFSGLWPIDRVDACGGFTGIYGYPGAWQPPSPQIPFDPLARPLPVRPAWQRAIEQGKRVKRGVARWQDRDGDGEPQTYIPDPSWRPLSPFDHPEGFIDFNEFYGWVQGEDPEVYDRYAELYGWEE
jgi:site-specific DNA-cytosine methylase